MARAKTSSDWVAGDRLPKEFGALDRNRVARQRNEAVGMHVGVGKVNRKRNIIVLNDRAHQRRPLALETEIVPGQKASAIEVESFRSRADDTDVALLVEHRESITIFQTAQRSLDEGSLGLDIVLG
jgi:hypothetical protein